MWSSATGCLRASATTTNAAAARTRIIGPLRLIDATSLPPDRLRVDQPFAFLNRDRLVRCGPAQHVDASARPAHAHVGDGRRRSEPEGERQLAPWAVAGSWLLDLPLPAAAG